VLGPSRHCSPVPDIPAVIHEIRGFSRGDGCNRPRSTAWADCSRGRAAGSAGSRPCARAGIQQPNDMTAPME